jgi:hypothetical protein
MPREPTITHDPSPETVAHVNKLLDAMGRLPWPNARARAKARAEAELELIAMGVDGAYAIRAIFGPASKQDYHQNRIGMRLLPWFPLLFIVLFLPIPLVGSDRGITISMSATLLVAAVTFWYKRQSFMRALNARYRSRLSQALQSIVQLNDKRTIPVLLDLQSLTDQMSMQNVTRNALTQLLPTVEPGDFELLTAEHRERINRLLSARIPIDPTSGAPFKPEYVTAILQALSRIGDASSLPAVERLANSPRSSKVRDAARACLPELRRRSADIGDALLRPSKPDEQGQELVRAAQESAMPANEELLRATGKTLK